MVFVSLGSVFPPPPREFGYGEGGGRWRGGSFGTVNGNNIHRIVSGGTSTGAPYAWLKLFAQSRVNSRCCFWSSPTGTWVALCYYCCLGISTFFLKDDYW